MKRSPSRARASQPIFGRRRWNTCMATSRPATTSSCFATNVPTARRARVHRRLGGRVAAPTSSSRAARARRSQDLRAQRLDGPGRHAAHREAPQLAQRGVDLRPPALAAPPRARAPPPPPRAWPAPRTAGCPASCRATASSASIFSTSRDRRAVSAATSKSPAMGMRSSTPSTGWRIVPARLRRRGHDVERAQARQVPDAAPRAARGRRGRRHRRRDHGHVEPALAVHLVGGADGADGGDQRASARPMSASAAASTFAGVRRREGRHHDRLALVRAAAARSPRSRRA